MQNKKRVRKTVTALAVGLFWLSVWQLAYYAIGRDLLLASPASVFLRIIELIGTGLFWQIVSSSFVRIMAGFLLGLVFGTLIAIMTARWSFMYKIFQLPMSIVKATPVASFVILALIWISGRKLSTFISFLMVLPMIWSSVHAGIKSADPLLLEAAASFRLSPMQKVKAIYLPAVMPHLLSVSQVAMGFAWKSGIAGEVIAIPKNTIGSMLYDAKVYLETTDLFAWTAVIVVLSVLIEKLFSKLMEQGARKWGGAYEKN